MLLNTFVVAVATWFTPLIAARAIKQTSGISHIVLETGRSFGHLQLVQGCARQGSDFPIPRPMSSGNTHLYRLKPFAASGSMAGLRHYFSTVFRVPHDPNAPDGSCWSWEGWDETGASFASIHRVHRGLFVDVGAIFQYSKVLARCCAWGLGVLTRTYLKESPARFLAGSSGAGHRLRDSGERGPAQPGFRCEPTPAASHPNRFVWQWVDFRPVRVWHGRMRFVLSRPNRLA